MSVFVMLLPLTVLSLAAFWKSGSILFMVSAGIALMLGLRWYVVYRDAAGMGVSLMIIGYAFFCAGAAFWNLFKKDEEVESE